MKVFILLCCFAVLVACNMGEPRLKEVARQETVTVYACGGWLEPQLMQIESAIADFNLKARYSEKNQFFVYGGARPALYGSGENDGIHCIYWIYDNYPTPAGRARWDAARPDDGERALAGEYYGRNIFIYGNGNCPPGLACTWMIQNVVAHELGHALGASHLSVEHAIMTTPVSSLSLTPADVEEICSSATCDPNYSAPAARLATNTYDGIAPTKFDCLTE